MSYESYREGAEDFFLARQEWSFATFGPPTDRKGIGPIRHLLKEVQEVLQELEKGDGDRDDLLEELVDCRFLLEDAIAREGFSYADYQDMSWRKLEKNKNRKWGARSADGVVEHIREEG
jgi:hypothetical protein